MRQRLRDPEPAPAMEPSEQEAVWLDAG